MKTDITPTDSVCPVFLEPAKPAQIAADAAEAQAQVDAKEAKAEARQAVLDKLGLNANEAAALFG
jgi:hypothetical protein